MKSKQLTDLSMGLSQWCQPRKNDSQGINLARLGHMGTHIDIMQSDGLPLSHCISPCHLIDVSEVKDRRIDVIDTKALSEQIQTGDSVLLRTDK